MVYMLTFWGCGGEWQLSTLPFSVLLTSHSGVIPQEQILSFKKRPYFGRAIYDLQGRKQESQKLYLFTKMAENYGSISMYL